MEVAMAAALGVQTPVDKKLIQRVLNRNTGAEDIERWKAERKKNYPTSKKVDEKEKERKEKIKRGEICGLPRAGKPFQFKKPYPPGPRRGQRPGPRPGQRPGQRPGAHPSVEGTTFRYKIQQANKRTRSYEACARRLKKVEYDQSDAWIRRPFAPDKKQMNVKVPFFSMNKSKVVHLESYYLDVRFDKNKKGKLKRRNKVKWNGFRAKEEDKLTDSESDDGDKEIPISDDEEGMEVTTKQTMMMMGGLVNYGSSEESEEENECKAKEEKTEKQAGRDKQVALQVPVVGSSSGSPQKKNLEDQEDDFKIEEFRQDTTFKNKPVFKKPRIGRRKQWLRSRFLETLLQDQIRKERNVILQACRFVRKNNFFEQKKK